ncbi:MAG TPA: DUF3343 domain-containing protein [Firmicutes bacterium]|nr:DUF3343 domain-containing protein [Bacillota bacterium]
MATYYVASFHSISQALRFEKLLQTKAIGVKMIPVPRLISSSCGIAARFEEADYPAVASLLAAGDGDAYEVYLFTSEGKNAQAERVWKANS